MRVFDALSGSVFELDLDLNGDVVRALRSRCCGFLLSFNFYDVWSANVICWCYVTELSSGGPLSTPRTRLIRCRCI